MSESAARSAGPGELRPELPFEQAVFVASPFGTFLTSAAIFLALYGAFLVCALVYGVELVRRAPGGVIFENGTWPAFVMSLLCATVLGMQRFALKADSRDREAFAQVLKGGESAARSVDFARRSSKLVHATWLGVGLGALLSVFILYNQGMKDAFAAPLVFVWFWLVLTALAVMFTRGVEMTRRGGRNHAKLLADELNIDLLRADRLTVLGRSATRPALIWLVTSAVICLFFVTGNVDWFTLALLGSSAAMGFWIFASSMLRVHHHIRAAKAKELESLRCQIETARAELHDDPQACARIQALLAYEARIENAREWAFDQPTALRVAVYLFIPATAWFGQAAAQFFVEHLVHV